jgi:PIN domain nuclease of toxin-antitoxin system
MKFLLDTHLVLWIPVSDARLSRAARLVLGNPDNRILFSVVSLWEIAIKCGLGKLDRRIDPRSIRRQSLEAGFEELPVLGQHAISVDVLPQIHKDPFDRLLIAQAIVEGITLLTADSNIARYPGSIRKV